MVERLKTYKNKMSESKSGSSAADDASGEVAPQRQQLFQVVFSYKCFFVLYIWELD